ncbi:hypothetical protein [Nocardiopsis sp. CNS-639]|uniref:hypothetical protein n=1 Tax=Nocardiopsis sp. CNS-639 TaxID=1169153 RepID=UPI0012DD2E56|nr:hypothetical protein [Nocardiopsis sp. CNS-639]
MTFELASQIIIAIFGFLGVVFPLIPRRQNRSLRDNIKEDLEIASNLPDGSAKDKLLQHVDAMVVQVCEEQNYRREPFGLVLGMSFIIFSAAGGIWVISAGGWWLVALVVLIPSLFMGIVGVTLDGTKKKRDSRGRSITE